MPGPEGPGRFFPGTFRVSRHISWVAESAVWGLVGLYETRASSRFKYVLDLVDGRPERRRDPHPERASESAPERTELLEVLRRTSPRRSSHGLSCGMKPGKTTPPTPRPIIVGVTAQSAPKESVSATSSCERTPPPCNRL